MSPPTEAPFEPVQTVNAYYDGPVSGLAHLGGQPHWYERRFETLDDDYSDVFDLWPLSQQTVLLVLESWSIWLRWLAAHKNGTTGLETHPALPADRDRHQILEKELTARLRQPPPQDTLRARAEFRHRSEQTGASAELDVRWTLVRAG